MFCERCCRRSAAGVVAAIIALGSAYKSILYMMWMAAPDATVPSAACEMYMGKIAPRGEGPARRLP